MCPDVSLNRTIPRSCSHILPKIPCLHLNRIDMQIWNIDVARPNILMRLLPYIETRTTAMEFIAAALG